jgi:hypothetical protein
MQSVIMLSVVRLSVIMLGVVMLSFVVLNVIMLSVVWPYYEELVKLVKAQSNKPRQQHL